MTRTVDPTTIGDEADGGELVHEVLEGRVDGVEEVGADEAFDDPERVPVICNNAM